MSTMIESKSLTKKYGNFTAVRNISFTLSKGEIYGLIGKNGAGKSTLFKMLMGLTEETSGQLSINQSTNRHELAMARKNVGFMMGANFFSYQNAFQMIEYFRILKGITEKNETERVLRQVDLWGVKKPFRAYSMGMKQRLSIANAMLGHPDVIILDEPTNGLDPQGIVDFRNLIVDMNQTHGITFMISSHILSELALIGTRFGIINDGELIQEITQSELHEHSRSGLLIEVDEVEKACVILEETLKTTRYKVSHQNELILDDYLDDPEMVAKALVNGGIGLRKLNPIQESLEAYYLKLVGGEQ